MRSAHCWESQFQRTTSSSVRWAEQLITELAQAMGIFLARQPSGICLQQLSVLATHTILCHCFVIRWRGVSCLLACLPREATNVSTSRDTKPTLPEDDTRTNRRLNIDRA
eukprot:SAG22_NODE_128_length_18787_cov_19.577108_16_plen_110_part_00